MGYTEVTLCPGGILKERVMVPFCGMLTQPHPSHHRLFRTAFSARLGISLTQGHFALSEAGGDELCLTGTGGSCRARLRAGQPGIS